MQLPSHLLLGSAGIMTKTLTLLGIESSCDETAAAVVRGDAIGPGQILSNEVFAQENLHIPYGGVVPELAARAHAEKIDHVVEDALSAAAMPLTDLDAIAVTAGPGLIGGVLSGVMTAKALSAAKGLPLIGVNHLAGHALTPRLTEGLAYPYLMLLVSGGHCQFLTAAPLMTRPARRSTNPPGCSASAIPVARPWSVPQNGAIPPASPCPGPFWTGKDATCPFPASKQPSAASVTFS